MTVSATSGNLDWLLNQLYHAKRALANEGISDPVFVLVTKSTVERVMVQEKLWRYFLEKYGTGDEPFKHMSAEAHNNHLSSFHFPTIGCRVVLIDVEETPG